MHENQNNLPSQDHLQKWQVPFGDPLHPPKSPQTRLARQDSFGDQTPIVLQVSGGYKSTNTFHESSGPRIKNYYHISYGQSRKTI